MNSTVNEVVLAASCAAVCVASPALAFSPPHGPPVRSYYSGGSGNGMKARLVVQLPHTSQGQRFPAFDDGVTLRDCRGNHQYVSYAGGGAAKEMTYPRGTFSDSGRGAVESYYNGQETFLRRYKRFTASGTVNHKTGSITYKIAGCAQRHYILRAKR